MLRISRAARAAAQRCWFSSYPAHQLLTFPALSPTMTQGTLSEWEKEEGDFIDVGDVIFTVETDKANVGYDAQDEGYLAKILIGNGTENVEVGTVVGVLVRILDFLCTTQLI